MFYTFDQNNSGGKFEGKYFAICIEADSAEKANSIAEERGLYFHGVEEGREEIIAPGDE